MWPVEGLARGMLHAVGRERLVLLHRYTSCSLSVTHPWFVHMSKLLINHCSMSLDVCSTAKVRLCIMLLMAAAYVFRALHGWIPCYIFSL